MNVIVERLQDKKVLEPTYPWAKFWLCSSGAVLLAKALLVRHEDVVLVVRQRDAEAARGVLQATGAVEGTRWTVRTTP